MPRCILSISRPFSNGGKGDNFDFWRWCSRGLLALVLRVGQRNLAVFLAVLARYFQGIALTCIQRDLELLKIDTRSMKFLDLLAVFNY